MNIGDLCRFHGDYVKTNYNFVGIFLGSDAKRYPWYNIKFLLSNGDVRVFALLKTEINQFVEVLHEAR